MPGADTPNPSGTVRPFVYTGRTEKPCCLCGLTEAPHRLDIPPRAVQLMKHSEPIAWQDIEGEVSIHFCEDDWATVRELVLETGMSPLSRCNAARASFVLREDFEALLNDTRSEPDQSPLEEEMLSEAHETLERHDSGDDLIEQRDLVEARVVEWALSDLSVA